MDVNFEYKLSICMPTYNDAAYISDALESIFDQSTPNIEVVILDGASSDDTETIVKSWMSKYRQIKYIKKGSKGGIDKDMDLSVREASGEYCWLMSSNDVLEEHSISDILSELVGKDDVFLCNRLVTDEYLQNPTFEAFFSSDIGATSIDFTDSNQASAYLASAYGLGSVFSFMSSIIVRRTSWLSVKTPENVYGTNYRHVYIILYLMTRGSRLRLIIKPLVTARGGADSFLGAGDIGVINRYLIDIDGYRRIIETLELDDDLEKQLKLVMLKQHPWYSWFRVVYRFDKKSDWIDLRESLSWYGYSGYTQFILSVAQGSKILRLLSNIRNYITKYRD